jgi:hypothetical protein
MYNIMPLETKHEATLYLDTIMVIGADNSGV